MISSLLTILLFPIVNRGCGSDWFGRFPYARAVFFAPLFIFPLVWTSQDLYTALWVSGGFVLWRFPAWRRWYTLGRMHVQDEADAFEKAIEKITTQPHLAFTIRNLILLTPLAIAVSPIFWALSVAIVACYELAWRVYPKNPIFIAEYLSGLTWAIAVLLS